MPYYGRPSKNCQSCRERRIRCDRSEPVCSQCKRAGKTCGGYRDVPSFVFRDENDKAARRSTLAKSRSEARRKRVEDSTADPDGSPVSLCPSRSSSVIQRRSSPKFLGQTIPAPVSFSLKEQGLKFFFDRFVTATSAVENSPYDIKSPAFLGAISLEARLRDAVISVGLAAMANVTQDRSLLLVSREKYVEAISSVRLAVGNPEQVSPDQTLKLIVMLSLYEMVCCAPNQVDSWTVHFDGVAALIKQTSFGQALKTSTARAQLQFYFLSIIKYFLTQREVPQELLNWSAGSIFSLQPSELPAVDLIDILIRFMKMHSSVRRELDPDPGSAVESASLFDAELGDWEQILPEQWRFAVRDSRDTSNTFNGKYIVYNDDVWAARDLNHYFWGRLLVNEMILYHLSRLTSPPLGDFRQRVLITASRMATSICAGAASQMSDSDGGSPSQSGTMSRLPPLNGVFMLLFPLTIAGSAGGPPDEVHEWVIQRLQKIGSTMGIQRALELIPKLQQLRRFNQQQIIPTDMWRGRAGGRRLTVGESR